MAQKDMMKDELMKKNLSTVPSFKIKENGDVAEEKKKCTRLLDEYEHFSNDGFIHTFFGAITKEQTIT